ncbi:hypothetical protein ABPG72_006703 [Tetrahymena utriculariae]
MIMYKTEYLKVSHNSIQFQKKHCQESQSLNNQTCTKNQMKADKQTKSDRQYNYTDNYQSIYEPEYFLNIFNLDINQGDSLNPNVGYHEGYNNLENLDASIQDVGHDETNQKFESQCYEQEMQLDVNRMQQQLYKHNLNCFDSNNNNNKLFSQCQNSFENKKQITQNKQNAFEQYYQESENHNTSTSVIKSDISCQNKSINEILCLKSKKLNTQNILKNIIYAFLKYFKEMKIQCKVVITDVSNSQLKNYRKQLVRYMKNHSFNYSVVKYLITHKFFKLLLLNFLEIESINWLGRSKVINKQEVQEKIQFLRNCIGDPKLFDELIIY